MILLDLFTLFLTGKAKYLLLTSGRPGAQILVINFWATWCPPCLKEIPLFIELQTEYAQQNVQFIGIAIDDPLLVDDYLSFIDINYPILIAETGGAKLSQKAGQHSECSSLYRHSQSAKPDNFSSPWRVN
ncbi:hypothetical protein BMR04_03560 [Methylococcaceae bacterium HT3]|nr:hypothetical protein BMR04_03560 [Methylococcaceae bacterium HT3]